MARLSWMVVWWLLAALLAAKHSALAQAALPLELSWRAPAACPVAGEVHTELARMARVRTGFVLQPLHAEVSVALERGVYRARLRTTHAGRAGARSLDAHDCATLVKSVALVLALSFGEGVEVAPVAPSEAATAHGAASAEPVPAATNAQPALAPSAAASSEGAHTPASAATDQAPAASDSTSALSAAGPPSQPRAQIAWHYLLGLGTQLNLLGPAMASVSAQLELERKALQLGLRTTASFGPERAVSADIDARFSAASAALEACGVLGTRRVTGSFCGAGHAGLLHGSSSGVSGGRSNAPWGALSVSAALTWPRSYWLRLRLQAGLAVSLYRARFVIEGLDEVERAGQLVPELALLMLFAP